MAAFDPNKHTMSRAHVASQLGISTSSVRRLEGDRLHPVLDGRGVWRFDPAEVGALAPALRTSGAMLAPTDPVARAAARRGRLAARVFRMFAADMGLAQIVVSTRQPPETIRELYREWTTSLDEAEWARRAAEQVLLPGTPDGLLGRPRRRHVTGGDRGAGP
jgi:hypothetical protein